MNHLSSHSPQSPPRCHLLSTSTGVSLSPLSMKAARNEIKFNNLYEGEIMIIDGKLPCAYFTIIFIIRNYVQFEAVLHDTREASSERIELD